MRRRHGIWIVGLVAAALGAAALGVHASSAAPTGPITHASTFDKTFSCRVRRQHFVNLYAGATLPPASGSGQKQPGGLSVTTVQKTREQNGATVTLTQVSLSARKNSLRIDMSTCRRVKQQIPLKPKGLPGPPITLTPHHQGFDNERCGATARVLVRLQFKTTNGVPSHALFAVRNDSAKSRPIAFYNWSPDKVSVYTANNCVVS
jgi:hypothetical protein